jgi:hypothetical protein
MPSRTVRSLAVLMILSVPAAANVTFDFETTPQGTVTPFSVTSGGFTATLSSPDGDVFSVADATGIFIVSLAGKVVWDPGFPSYPLDIVFSEPVVSMSLSFALAGFPVSSTIDVRVFTGGTGGALVATTSAMGGPAPPGFFPEGVVTISGPVFDAVRLTSNVESIAIDNLSVLPAAEVPEPSSAALALTALGASLLLVRRRRRGIRHGRTFTPGCIPESVTKDAARNDAAQ